MKKLRNNEIDFWRVVFAILIISYHSSNLLLESEKYSIFKGGYIGVEFFLLYLVQ